MWYNNTAFEYPPISLTGEVEVQRAGNSVCAYILTHGWSAAFSPYLRCFRLYGLCRKTGAQMYEHP